MAASFTLPTVLANLVAGNQALSLVDGDFTAVYNPLVSLNTYSNYYTDVGAANSYAVTVSSPQTVSLTAGLEVTFIATNANTGASTLQINALAAKSILNRGGVALVPGDIQASGVVTVTYDGTNFQLTSRPQRISPIASGRNIAARTNAATPNTKIDITADQLILQDASGNSLVANTVSVTIDFGTVGANGLDTSTQASSTWYYDWVIAKSDGTVAGLGSLSSSAPTMPTGYTYKALVSDSRSDGSTHFIPYIQKGNRANYMTAQNALNSSVVGTGETTVSTTTFVPPNAEEAILSSWGQVSTTAGAASSQMQIGYITGTIRNKAQLQCSAASASAWGFECSLPNTQQVFASFANTTNVTSSLFEIDVLGFKLPVGGE